MVQFTACQLCREVADLAVLFLPHCPEGTQIIMRAFEGQKVNPEAPLAQAICGGRLEQLFSWAQL